MTDLERSTDRPDDQTSGDVPKDQQRDFEPPSITKLGKLTRVVKASGAGAVTIGAGVG